MERLPPEIAGWWRITETSRWVDDGLDILGPALLSLTGYGDESTFVAERWSPTNRSRSRRATGTSSAGPAPWCMSCPAPSPLAGATSAGRCCH